MHVFGSSSNPRHRPHAHPRAAIEQDTAVRGGASSGSGSNAPLPPPPTAPGLIPVKKSLATERLRAVAGYINARGGIAAD